MKKILLITSFLLLPIVATAQITAVMKVTVDIISGAKTEIPTDLIVSQSTNSSQSSEIMITSTPFADIDIKHGKICTLTNDLGEKIQLQTDTLLTVNSESGLHTLSVSGLLPHAKPLSGQYRGNMLTTIEYL